MEQFSFPFRRASKAELSPSALLLVGVAEEAAAKAYAPYSNFAVGASARLSDGRVLTGANHENASYPVGICAERALLAGLDMRDPGVTIEEMAVTYKGKGSEPISPCGMCRQSILEVQHWQKAPIRLLLCSPADDIIIIDDAEWLLPFAFSGKLLG